MSGMYFLFPTLLAILFSFLVVRGAAVALMMTGMEKKKARFQALSAFSGTGFTTKEAEFVVNNPQRRKIITWLIIFGNAGIVTVIVAATSSMATSRGYQLPINIVILAVGIFLIYKIATYKKFTRYWEKFIENKLIKSPVFEEATTEDLLHFLEGYGLVKKIVGEKSGLVSKTLAKSHLREKGAVVLGIEREKSWIPVPKANEVIKRGDRLVVYGPLNALRDILKQ
ncbi:MAG: TrkA C-terminal domain-containing protein [Candidatus Aminicenantes bacterium]|nr:TrkA C-terminal domain-containing protein [Candidatus Aminicenantes bacterium]